MLSIYAVTVWCVDRIGIEPSVDFQALGRPHWLTQEKTLSRSTNTY
jgi:hypothetical protein